MLKTRMLLALVLAATVTGCGYVESRRNAVVRAVAGSVICPIMIAQALSPLTQGSHGESDAVASRAEASAPQEAKSAPAVPDQQELAIIQPSIAPVSLKPADIDARQVVKLASIDVRQIDLPVIANVSVSELAVSSPFEFVQAGREGYVTIEQRRQLDRARESVAAARCAIQQQIEQRKQRQRVMVIVHTDDAPMGS